MNIELAQTALQPVKNIKIPDVFYRRIKTGISAFDDFLSGGWLPGSSFTFTARAGLGKSRLMLQTLEGIKNQGSKVAYISCEESIYQIAYTCEQLGVKEIEIANVSDVDVIANAFKDHNMVIVDSFQGLTTKHNLNKTDHEKYCVERLINEAKKTECVVGIICHQTKNGQLKGSSLIQHEVDATMELGLPEEVENENQRVVLFSKNRFGALNELSCEMNSSGYIFTESHDQEVKPHRKLTKRETVIKQILDLPGVITLKQVMPLVNGDVHRAMMYLREMVLNEILTKTGRGNEATYQKKGAAQSSGEAVTLHVSGSPSEASNISSQAGA